MRDPQLHIPIAQRVLLTKLSRGCSLCDAQVSRNSELSTQNSDTKERWADDHGLSTFLRTPNRCYKLLHREQKDPSQPHTKPAPGATPMLIAPMSVGTQRLQMNMMLQKDKVPSFGDLRSLAGEESGSVTPFIHVRLQIVCAPATHAS